MYCKNLRLILVQKIITMGIRLIALIISNRRKSSLRCPKIKLLKLFRFLINFKNLKKKKFNYLQKRCFV